MCGFAGFIDFPHAHTGDGLERIVNAMGAKIAHRGPDDSHFWTDPESGIAMAFRRLAIQDLSPAGRQPMQSRSGRYMIVFNGEIYNAPSLKAGLVADGTQLRGHSDTEILIELIDRIGFAACMPLLRGMFAMACWDRRDRILHLARDPLGKKPLYFGFNGGTFLFASQPKAFHAYPQFKPEIDRNALCAFSGSATFPPPIRSIRTLRSSAPEKCSTFRTGAFLTEENSGMRPRVRGPPRRTLQNSAMRRPSTGWKR